MAATERVVSLLEQRASSKAKREEQERKKAEEAQREQQRQVEYHRRNHGWQARVRDCPTYHPTKEQFCGDLVGYLRSIAPEAAQYGTCKLVVPPGCRPAIAPGQVLNQNAAEGRRVFTFTSRQQKLRPVRWLNWSSGDLLYDNKSHTLAGFQELAHRWSTGVLGSAGSMPPEFMELEFWRRRWCDNLAADPAGWRGGEGEGPPEGAQARGGEHRQPAVAAVAAGQQQEPPSEAEGDDQQAGADDAEGAPTAANRGAAAARKHGVRSRAGGGGGAGGGGRRSGGAVDPLDIHYANDVPGTCFAAPQTGDPLGSTAWNLNLLPEQPGVLLPYLDTHVAGVTCPMLYIGWAFAAFNWHIEDHYLCSINYHHAGASKTWYSIPAHHADRFEQLVQSSVYRQVLAAEAARGVPPELRRDHALWSLLNKTTLLHPKTLMDGGVEVYRTVQAAGEFVITWPRAFHAGFSHGFNLGEAVNFGLPEWLPYGLAADVRLARLRRGVLLHTDFLACAEAMRVLASWAPAALGKEEEVEAVPVAAAGGAARAQQAAAAGRSRGSACAAAAAAGGGAGPAALFLPGGGRCCGGGGGALAVQHTAASAAAAAIAAGAAPGRPHEPFPPLARPRARQLGALQAQLAAAVERGRSGAPPPELSALLAFHRVLRQCVARLSVLASSGAELLPGPPGPAADKAVCSLCGSSCFLARAACGGYTQDALQAAQEAEVAARLRQQQAHARAQGAELPAAAAAALAAVELSGAAAEGAAPASKAKPGKKGRAEGAGGRSAAGMQRARQQGQQAGEGAQAAGAAPPAPGGPAAGGVALEADAPPHRCLACATAALLPQHRQATGAARGGQTDGQPAAGKGAGRRQRGSAQGVVVHCNRRLVVLLEWCRALDEQLSGYDGPATHLDASGAGLREEALHGTSCGLAAEEYGWGAPYPWQREEGWLRRLGARLQAAEAEAEAAGGQAAAQAAAHAAAAPCAEAEPAAARVALAQGLGAGAAQGAAAPACGGEPEAAAATAADVARGGAAADVARDEAAAALLRQTAAEVAQGMLSRAVGQPAACAARPPRPDPPPATEVQQRRWASTLSAAARHLQQLLHAAVPATNRAAAAPAAAAGEQAGRPAAPPGPGGTAAAHIAPGAAASSPAGTAPAAPHSQRTKGRVSEERTDIPAAGVVVRAAASGGGPVPFTAAASGGQGDAAGAHSGGPARGAPGDAAPAAAAAPCTRAAGDASSGPARSAARPLVHGALDRTAAAPCAPCARPPEPHELRPVAQRGGAACSAAPHRSHAQAAPAAVAVGPGDGEQAWAADAGAVRALAAATEGPDPAARVSDARQQQQPWAARGGPPLGSAAVPAEPGRSEEHHLPVSSRLAGPQAAGQWQEPQHAAPHQQTPLATRGGQLSGPGSAAGAGWPGRRHLWGGGSGRQEAQEQQGVGQSRQAHAPQQDASAAAQPWQPEQHRPQGPRRGREGAAGGVPVPESGVGGSAGHAHVGGGGEAAAAEAAARDATRAAHASLGAERAGVGPKPHERQPRRPAKRYWGAADGPHAAGGAAAGAHGKRSRIAHERADVSAALPLRSGAHWPQPAVSDAPPRARQAPANGTAGAGGLALAAGAGPGGAAARAGSSGAASSGGSGTPEDPEDDMPLALCAAMRAARGAQGGPAAPGSPAPQPPAPQPAAPQPAGVGRSHPTAPRAHAAAAPAQPEAGAASDEAAGAAADAAAGAAGAAHTRLPPKRARCLPASLAGGAAFSATGGAGAPEAASPADQRYPTRAHWGSAAGAASPESEGPAPASAAPTAAARPAATPADSSAEAWAALRSPAAAATGPAGWYTPGGSGAGAAGDAARSMQLPAAAPAARDEAPGSRPAAVQRAPSAEQPRRNLWAAAGSPEASSASSGAPLIPFGSAPQFLTPPAVQHHPFRVPGLHASAGAWAAGGGVRAVQSPAGSWQGSGAGAEGPPGTERAEHAAQVQQQEGASRALLPAFLTWQGQSRHQLLLLGVGAEGGGVEPRTEQWPPVAQAQRVPEGGFGRLAPQQGPGYPGSAQVHLGPSTGRSEALQPQQLGQWRPSAALPAEQVVCRSDERVEGSAPLPQGEHGPWSLNA